MSLHLLYDVTHFLCLVALAWCVWKLLKQRAQQAKDVKEWKTLYNDTLADSRGWKNLYYDTLADQKKREREIHQEWGGRYNALLLRMQMREQGSQEERQDN